MWQLKIEDVQSQGQRTIMNDPSVTLDFHSDEEDLHYTTSQFLRDARATYAYKVLNLARTRLVPEEARSASAYGAYGWSGVLNFLLPCSPSSDPSSSIPSCFSHHEVLIMQGMLEWTSTLTQLASIKTGFSKPYIWIWWTTSSKQWSQKASFL